MSRPASISLLGCGLLAAVLTGCAPGDGASVVDKLMAGVRALVGGEVAPDAPAKSGGEARGGARKGGKSRTHVVEVAPVTVDALRLSSVNTGSLRSSRTVRIFNQEEGRLTELPHFEGDRVAAGTLLMALDDALLAAQHAKAKALRSETEANLARLVGLRAGKMVPEEQYLRATTAAEIAKAEELVLRTRLGYTRVMAPFSGVVSERLVEPGDILARHTHVLTLIDPEAIVIDIDVSEILLANLRRGTSVSVRIDALGDTLHEGKVARIHPALNPRTRHGRVELALAPVPPGARPGQFARATFTVEDMNRTTVPFAALRRDASGEYVMRVADGERVSRVAVRSGRRVADRVEIVEGLGAADAVVVRGFLGLEDGMAVEPVAQGHTTADGQSRR